MKTASLRVKPHRLHAGSADSTLTNRYNTAGKGSSFDKGTYMATKGKNPFLGKESKAEEAKEKKQFPTKRGYAAMEAKKEGEKMPKFAAGGDVPDFVKNQIADNKAKKAAKPYNDSMVNTPAAPKKYAKGGGVEVRGKTRGTMVAMACGGKVKK